MSNRSSFTGTTYGKAGRSPARACRRSGRPRGSTLVEALVAALVSLVIGGAMLMMMQTTYTSRSTLMGENAALRDARRSLDTLANNMRNAQMVTGSGVFSAASSNAVTCYTATDGSTTTRYWLDTSEHALKQTDASGTKRLLSGVQTLQFTFYVSSSTNFTSASSSWTTTSDPSNPTATEIPNLGGVAIQVTISSGGYSRTLSTLVRLRNSPAKPHI